LNPYNINGGDAMNRMKIFLKAVFIIFCIGWLYGCHVSTHHSDPPEGWIIISDGEKYAFKMPAGTISDAQNTYQDAVDASWGQYQFNQEDDAMKNWSEVKR